MEALVSTMIGLLGTQWVRMGAEMKADFKAWKDFWAASVKFHAHIAKSERYSVKQLSVQTKSSPVKGKP